MKRTLFLLMLLFLFRANAISSYAQDLILTKGNAIIEANVIEVGKEYIVYKPYGVEGGNSLTISVSEVQKIDYQDGRETEFYAKKVNSAKPLMSTNPSELRFDFFSVYNGNGQKLSNKVLSQYLSKKDFAKYRFNKTIDVTGFVIFSGSLLEIAGVGLWGKLDNTIYETAESFSLFSKYLLGGLGGAIVGGGLCALGAAANKRLINKYNQQHASTFEYDILFGPTDNGIGLALRF